MTEIPPERRNPEQWRQPPRGGYAARELPPADEHERARLEAIEAETELTRPTFAPITRTRVYVACLALDVAAVLGFGLAAIFDWLPDAQAAAALALVLGAVGAIGHGLGVAYRPTRPGAPR
jgi:hypothetical protein